MKQYGGLVCWGHPEYGGDASVVAPLLAEGVIQVVGNNAAFAAVKQDGRVVCWGDPSQGGDTSAVAPLLARGVIQVW